MGNVSPVAHGHFCAYPVPAPALQSAVNLLSSVLDTPEFFWRAPDSYQSLYEAICQVWVLDLVRQKMQ